MSSLRSIAIPTALVALSDKEGFTVRGMSPNDAMCLYYAHAGELSSLYEKFVGRVTQGDEIDAGQVVESLVSGAPTIIAEVIALASGSDPKGAEWKSDVGIALQLSTGVQMDALQKIGELTFTSDMPFPKFLGLVQAMAGSTKAAVQKKAA